MFSLDTKLNVITSPVLALLVLELVEAIETGDRVGKSLSIVMELLSVVAIT